jgi:tagatose 6-phosphate kinase
MILTVGTTPAVARVMRFNSVTLDTVNRATSVVVSAAGKSINVARVLTTLGHACVCAGFAGGGPGKALRDNLTSVGIAHALVETHSSTRVCITVIDDHAGQATELVQEADAVDVDEIKQLSDIIISHAVSASVIVCAGTLAPGVDELFYAQVVQSAGNKPVIVDAHGPALVHACAAGAIAKCNAEELSRTFAGAVSPAQAALNQGAAAVLITDGPRGAELFTRGGALGSAFKLSTPVVKVVSPIGSGDAVAAGFAAGIERGWTLVESARLGIACGSANAQTAVAGQVDADEVLRLMLRVKVADLN